MIYYGIDPGKSGAVAAVYDDGQLHGVAKFAASASGPFDPAAARELLRRSDETSFALLERVSSMPRQGVASSFKFGSAYGWCLGALDMEGLRYQLITPAKWQGLMGCRTGGQKNVSKAAAQRLFPAVRVTHAIADALLLAECCRRMRMGVEL